MKKNILFDTDIGTDIDDTLALLFLLSQKNIKLLAVSTVYGPTLIRAQVALTLINLINKRTPVIVGKSQPNINKPIWTGGKEHIGINIKLSPSVLSIENQLLKTSSKITILATGPLTNIAKLQLNGTLEKKCNHLVIMGGVLPTKQLPQVEHNFSSDPHAAKIVFKSNVPITLVPLNITSQFILSPIDIKKLTNINTPVGKLIKTWTHNWLTITHTFPKHNIFHNKIFLHDLIASAIACSISHISKRVSVTINNKTGKINLSNKGSKINIVTDINKDIIQSIFTQIINSLRKS